MAEDCDKGSSSGEIAARLGRSSASFGPIRANLIAKGLDTSHPGMSPRYSMGQVLSVAVPVAALHSLDQVGGDPLHVVGALAVPPADEAVGTGVSIRVPVHGVDLHQTRDRTPVAATS